MSTGPQWPPPPPPPGPPPPGPPPPRRRYAPKWVWLGIGAGCVATLALPWFGLAVFSVVDFPPLAQAVALLGFIVPLVLGIVLTARQGSMARRSRGLGLIIGWALAPLIFAGVCTVVVLVQLSNTGG